MMTRHVRLMTGAMIVLLMLSAAIYACADTCTNHHFVTVSSTPSTCTRHGSRVEKCTICGLQKPAQTLPLQPHEYQADGWVTVTEATCTQPGQRQVTCIRCGHIETETIEPHHDWGEWIDDRTATCTAGGHHHRICGVCGEGDNEALEPLGHDWNVITEATCTKGGRQVCLRCELAEDTPIQHNWKLNRAPTCKSEGKRTCTLCHTEEILPRTDHTWNQVRQPSCFREGLEKCQVCGMTQPVEMLPHTWGTPVTEPTCLNPGMHRCTVAGCKAQEELPALGHLPVVNVPAAESTCTEAGCTEGVICGRCQDVLTESQLLPVAGHDHQPGQTVPPLDGEDGYTLYICTVCGDEYKDDLVAWVAAEHVTVTLRLQDGTELPAVLHLEGSVLQCTCDELPRSVTTLLLPAGLPGQLMDMGVTGVQLDLGGAIISMELNDLNSEIITGIITELGSYDSILLVLDPAAQTADVMLTFGSMRLSVLALTGIK